MKLSLLALTCASAAFLAAQPVPLPVKTPGAPPLAPAAPPAPPIPPETVVVTVDGKPYTAKQMDDILKLLPAQGLAVVKQNPEVGLTQLFMLYGLSDEGAKRKLDHVSPYQESIDSRHRQYLANILVQDQNTHITVNQPEQEAYYEAHKELYQSVKISAIYLGYTPNPKPGADGKMPRTEAETKAKADDLVKQLRAGGDFAKLAAENSDDKESAKKGGEYATIRKSDNYPPAIKEAIFKLKDDEISEPVKQVPGFYIFKVTAHITQPYKEVQEALFQRVKQEKFDNWLKGMQKELSPTIEKPDYFADAQATPGTSSSISELPVPVAPDTVVAKVGGKPYTAKEMDVYLKLLPAQGRAALKKDPVAGLTQLFLIYQLSEEAKKRKLDQESPHKESLEMMTREGLANAVVDQERNTLNPSPAEQEAFYKSHTDQFETAKVSAILVSFSPNPKPGPDGKMPRTEAEAKARAEELVKQLRAGGDFVEVAKSSSDDKDTAAKGGEYATIRRSDYYPEAMKTIVFGLKTGDVSEPLRQPAGFYIFKVTSKTTQPFAEVSATVGPKVKAEKFNQWIATLQAQYKPKIEKPEYFKK